MIQFILKRLLNGLSIVLGVICVVFFLFQVLPGDPVEMMMGQRADEVTRKAIVEEYHLDKSKPQQLMYYINDLSPLSFHEATVANQEKYNYISLISFGELSMVLKKPFLGKSYQSNRVVKEIIVEGFKGTFWLAITAMIIACIFGITMGIFSALYHNTWIDRVLVTGSVVGISAPSFVAGTLIAYVFAFLLHDYTGLNLTGYLFEIDPFKGEVLQLKNLILPAITLGIRPLAIITQLTRSTMLDVMQADYIRTARAKGLSENTVVWKHALKNALNPVITAVSGWFASLLAGAFFIEYIFSWKGLGLITINAVFKLDLPVIMGSTLFIACIFVIITVFVDVLYGIVDPRVKLG